MKGFKVQYSDDEEEVCIIPNPSISTQDFNALIELFMKKGYKYWVPADDRRGYNLVKENRKK